MSNSLTIFNNPQLGMSVRAITVNDEPMFVAKDVCDALEIVNNRDAVSSLDQDQKVHLTRTQIIANIEESISSGIELNGSTIPNRGLTFINEAGVYALIFKSRKEEAVKFQDWICEEVLPSIRKTGSYSIAKEESPIDRFARFMIRHGVDKEKVTNALILTKQQSIEDSKIDC